MLRNYLQTAFRNFRKRISFTFLNIAGLAIGIACAGLIFLWVKDELSYDDYFSNKANLYKIKDYQTYDGQTFTFDSSPGPLAEAVKEEVPGVKNTTRCSWTMEIPFMVSDKDIMEKGLYVDPAFLQMFQIKFIEGESRTAFQELKSVVVTKKLAEKLFGNVNVVGKSVRMGNNESFMISGVVADLPQNVTLKFEWLAPFKNFENQNDWLKGWGNNGVVTFVETKPGANIKAINHQLYDFLKTKGDNLIAKFAIYPMSKWHLYDEFENGKEVEGRMKFVRLFTIIAWIILIIACINFMNLATAQSERRSREVGVRKVLGSSRWELVRQFMTESFLMATISAAIAVLLIIVLLPAFNTLVDKELILSLKDSTTWIGLLCIIILCGLVAGSYPALYLSSFQPVKVLKVSRASGKDSASLVRKGLVILQFAISITLIISTIIIFQQINHAKSRDLGYNKNNLIVIPLHGDMKKNYAVIRDGLLATGNVSNTGLSQDQVLQYGSNTGDFGWQGKDPNKQILITISAVNEDFIPTAGYKILKGRNFYPGNKIDSANIVINKTLADMLNTKQPIGSVITSGDGEKLTVIGVVDNFIYNSVYSKPSPLIFYKDTSNVNNLFVRFKENADLQKAVASMVSVIKSQSPGFPVNYRFVDAEFDKLFKMENLIGSLATLFATLAIIISCLGLFGLAAYTAERRTREMGIRKVLGASVSRLVTLISLDFLKLVGIACLISFPIAWWAMHSWLENFAYRISISWTIFALSALLAIVIAIITVSFQSIKAARVNPVKSIKNE